MTPERVHHLLQGYAFGTLSPDELQELSAAALDDEDLFLKMAEADDQRRILAVPGVRAEALRIVRQAADTKPSWLGSFSWLLQPSRALPVLGLAVLATFAVIYYYDRPGDKYNPTDVQGQLFKPEAEAVARLEAAGTGPGMTIAPEQWMNSTATEGANLAFRVQLTEPASVVVVQQMPDGRARFVYPESLTEPTGLQSGEHRIALEASPPGSGISGPVRLVVLAFSPATDVRLPGSDLEAARQRMTRRDISYVVRSP